MSHAPPQSKKMSLVEVWTNVFIGYAINQTAQIMLFPLVGIHVSYGVNFALGAMFTVISVVRSYCLRRFYEWWRTYSHVKTHS